MRKTRLDRVTELRKRKEETALTDLARARDGLEQAGRRLARSTEKAGRDGRSRAPAELWQLEESEHSRALEAVKRAQRELEAARAAERGARGRYVDAHRETQVVQRAAGRKRAEMAEAAEKGERKDLDEIATQLFNRGR